MLRTSTTPGPRSQSSRPPLVRSTRKPSPRSSTTPTSYFEMFHYPAEHWIHLRTTNSIESTFATVRLRTRVIKGPGSRATGIAMAYKLIENAETQRRAVNAPHLIALVRAGATSTKGNWSSVTS